MKKMFLLIAVIAIVWSCEKTETISNDQSNSRINSLKTDTTDPTSGLELEVVVDNSLLQGIINNKSRLPIATLWRKKANCHKLGICKWFPKPTIDPSTSFVGREVSLPIIYDASNGTFTPIILAFTSTASFLNSDDIKFYIDEDFELTVTSEMNLPFQTLRIVQNEIDFDSTIGQYGGYTLNINGIN